MARLLSKSIVYVLTLLAVTPVPAASYKTIPMNQKQLATYYVDASLSGGGDVEFMVDTGAGYTTINEHTLELLLVSDNAVYVGELTGVMADGRQQHFPVYRIKQLVLGGDCVLSNIEVAVFPQKTRMLLGLTALEKAAPFVFSTNPPRLSLSNCGSSSS